MELPNSTVSGSKRRTVYATEAQRDFIAELLERVGASLEDYTDTFESNLTISEASEIIDALKDEAGFDEEYDE